MNAARMLLASLAIALAGCQATVSVVVKGEGIASPVFVAKRVEFDYKAEGVSWRATRNTSN